MIALLLILLAGFASVFGVSGPSDLPPVGPTTTEEPPTTTDWEPLPAGQLEKISVERQGGIAFQAFKFDIDDPATLASLAPLVPAELPQVTGPTGACADCWEYRFVFDYVNANESVLREYDDASIPPGLEAFTAAINDYIASSGVQPSEPDVN